MLPARFLPLLLSAAVSDAAGDRGDKCTTALASFCGAAVKVSVSGCKACVTQHLDGLVQAGCTSSDMSVFCSLAPAPGPPPSPAVQYKCVTTQCTPAAVGTDLKTCEQMCRVPGPPTPAPMPPPTLYECAATECVPKAGGVDIDTCQKLCRGPTPATPAPNPANDTYVCSGVRCVVRPGGVDIDTCQKLCHSPPVPPTPAPPTPPPAGTWSMQMCLQFCPSPLCDDLVIAALPGNCTPYGSSAYRWVTGACDTAAGTVTVRFFDDAACTTGGAATVYKSGACVENALGDTLVTCN